MMCSIARLTVALSLCLALGAALTAHASTPETEGARTDPAVVLKTRAHYYPLGAVLGFDRVYVQSESRVAGRHGLGLSADITWSPASDDVWGAGSSASGGAVGLNYRYVFDDAYFADGFYVHLSTVLRRLRIDYALEGGDSGAMESLAFNAFLNGGYQWYLFDERVQIGVGFGIDVNAIFDPTIVLRGGGTMPMEDVEGAPQGVFIPVPDIDFTVGFAF